jgi:hypothetical protein
MCIQPAGHNDFNRDEKRPKAKKRGEKYRKEVRIMIREDEIKK